MRRYVVLPVVRVAWVLTWRGYKKMAKLSKRIRAIREKVPAGKVYAVKDAFALLKDLPLAKFRESVDISVNLGVDSRKSDQAIRGSLVLPKGTGRQVRVAVFTSSAHADAALKAGADIVGLVDLATPDAMRIVGQLGQVLGPRGLMPNPKDGTVTTDIATAVQNARKGQIRYRTDKAGIVHCMIGKLDFSVEDLIQNFETVIAALKKAKPSTAKGIYFKKVTVSSTMGPGLAIDIASMDS